MKPCGSGLLVLLGIFVSGCGIAAKIQARNDMMQAKNAYTQCLAENSADSSKCQGLKEAYDADLRAYLATSSEVRPGSVVDVQTSP